MKIPKDRVTGLVVPPLKDNEIFVFGSNFPHGRHGAGAAKQAKIYYGAKYGQGEGLMGQSYGLPTVDWTKNYKPLNANKIKPYADNFIQCAKDNPQLTFLLTDIGCGLAGNSPKDIAPLFKECIDMENVKMPQCFWEVLLK